MDLSTENSKKIRGLIVFTILLLAALWNDKLLVAGAKFLGHLISPFVLGGGIALVLNVPMSFLERKLFPGGSRFGRSISLLLTIVVVLTVVCLVFFIVLPELGRTALGIGGKFQELFPKVQEWTVSIFSDYPEIARSIEKWEFDWEKMAESFLRFLKNGAGGLYESPFSAAMTIVSTVSASLIAFAFSCYVLLQKEKLSLQVQKLMYAFLPEDWTDILIAFGRLTCRTFSAFLAGQCLEAVILGSIFFVAMIVFRLPYALLISVLVGFTALVPIFGALIGCVVGATLIFMISPMKALLFLGLFLVLQQIEGTIIYPRVVGSSVGLSPIWVLVAVSLGAGLMGVVGMVIFIPIVSVVYTMLRGIVNRRLKKRGIEI